MKQQRSHGVGIFIILIFGRVVKIWANIFTIIDSIIKKGCTIFIIVGTYGVGIGI